MEQAIIYARVSTTDQAENGISLDAQVAICSEYCGGRDLTIVESIVDAVSAKDIDHRPGLKRILDMARQRSIAHVVTWKLDRFSRNTIDALQMVAAFAKLGVELHIVSEQSVVRTDTADDEFLLTLKASLAQRERKLIGERTKLALARKREKLEYCGGEPPYGYRDENGSIVPDLEEQAVIRKIRNLRRQGFSIRRIVACLHDDGHLNRRGKPFQKTQVERILARNAA